ncbi:alanine aminotransferase 2-like [Dermatophagoides pteronyssinus]|uniref:alanine aminotransferase 2-like n=1 Tax=Dermatophagoides pteronyssinus TaxID=6956 RepID=UPI003F67423A
MNSTRRYGRLFHLSRNINYSQQQQQRSIAIQRNNCCRHTITLDNINDNVKRLEYAVRGPLVIRAGVIENELRQSSNHHPKPFNEVIRANIGDCHAMGQRPLTFLRQVLACSSDDSLLNYPNYPDDVKERTRSILKYCGGQSVGAYSDSTGVEIIRKHCAEYITNRDGIESEWRDIALTTGASEGIRSVLALINTISTDTLPSGVMIPIPQYPLYSATITEYGMYPINYYLDEDNQWSLNIDELKRSLNEAKGKCKPKAIVVINPGNPTGSVLTKKNIEDIIHFAKENKILIIADEVYQHNIWDGEFFSFKKILNELNEDIELASVMSASKGYMGECGLRGGYCELVNFDQSVKAMFYKMLSARLCSSILGQIALDCIVKPPDVNGESYQQYQREKFDVLESLKYRAKLVADTFNEIPGIKSNKVAGAMYAFPQIDLPKKAQEKAAELGQKPDFFYAMNLLETTGICVVPGSGFGQIPGTYHFRTTILPQNEKLETMMKKFKEFHQNFMKQYS